MLGVALPSLTAHAAAADGPTMLTAWLRIAPDDGITVAVSFIFRLKPVDTAAEKSASSKSISTPSMLAVFS